MPIAGKSVIVTGGTSGIGEGCSRHFAEIGAKVVIASNQPEAGTALADNIAWNRQGGRVCCPGGKQQALGRGEVHQIGNGIECVKKRRISQLERCPRRIIYIGVNRGHPSVVGLIDDGKGLGGISKVDVFGHIGDRPAS